MIRKFPILLFMLTLVLSVVYVPSAQASDLFLSSKNKKTKPSSLSLSDQNKPAKSNLFLRSDNAGSQGENTVSKLVANPSGTAFKPADSAFSSIGNRGSLSLNSALASSYGASSCNSYSSDKAMYDNCVLAKADEARSASLDAQFKAQVASAKATAVSSKGGSVFDKIKNLSGTVKGVSGSVTGFTAGAIGGDKTSGEVPRGIQAGGGDAYLNEQLKKEKTSCAGSGCWH